MKCTSKRIRGIFLLLLIVLLTGCSSKVLVKEYKTSDNGSVWKAQGSQRRSVGLAADLCIVNEEIIPGDMESLAGAGAAGLFNLTNKQVLYATNVHQKMYPASITKLMTALLFLESYQGDYSETVTASASVAIKESGAQMCGYKEGDQITLDQLIHGLLVYSGNDAAMIVAEYVSGSVEEFVTKMNQRAQQIGATNTHFTNPHGLHEEQHYTTAYDLYLIFQQVMKYDKFREIINKKEYEGEYIQANGKTKTVKWISTNLYLAGEKEIPQGVAIVGGKTGTTKSAGACLMLLFQNAQGSDYIAIVLKDTDKETLYADMTKLLVKSTNSD